MRKIFKFILFLFSTYSFSLSAQTRTWNPYSSRDSCSRLIYSVWRYEPGNDTATFRIWNYESETDTILSLAQIKCFYIQNPSKILRNDVNSTVELLEKLYNVEELFFYGDDSDTFKGLTENEFEKFIRSKKLTKIHIRNVDETKYFEKFMRKKYKNISVIKS